MSVSLLLPVSVSMSLSASVSVCELAVQGLMCTFSLEAADCIVLNLMTAIGLSAVIAKLVCVVRPPPFSESFHICACVSMSLSVSVS